MQEMPSDIFQAQRLQLGAHVVNVEAELAGGEPPALVLLIGFAGEGLLEHLRGTFAREDADSGPDRHFVASQTDDPTPLVAHGDTDMLWANQPPSRPEVVTQRALRCHDSP